MKLTKTQSILFPVVIAALALISWQVFNATRSTQPNKARVVQNKGFHSRVPKPISTNSGYINDSPAPNLALMNSPTSTATPTFAGTKPALQKPGVSNAVAISKAEAQLSSRQREYLELVNEYKVSQMKRLIEQDNEAIAIARQHATQAALETAHALGKRGTKHAKASEFISASDDAYKLIYTGKQGGKWNATVREHGHLVDVMVGNTLPDGSKVVSIDDNMVVLRNGDHKKVVSFYATTDTLIKPAPVTKVARVAEQAKQPKKPVAMRVVTAPKQNVQTQTSAAKPNTDQRAPSKVVAVVKPSKPVTKVAVKETVKSLPSVKTSQQRPVQVSAQHKVQRKDLTKAEKDLLDGDDSAYTIQLLANTKLSSVKEFIAENHLQDKAEYYKTQLHGMPLYVVVYKQFPSTEAALQAIGQLPIELQRYSPFVKTIGAVKRDLNKVA